jgi:poly-gamma-glutamate synthesis protein (capsule biosynthesis protein)
MRLVALGQSLILRDLASQHIPGLTDVRARLVGADVVFSNFEAAVGRPSPPPGPTDPPPAAVIADASVLDSLRALSINLLSLSNNHADDGGPEGFAATIEATRRRGFATAGTGRNLAEASRPAYLKTTNGMVALIAMASNALTPDGIATDTRPGVNHLTVRGSAVDPADSMRVLDAIREAARQAETVVVYQHDHYWAPNWQDTPEWKKAWCRACIDAGATVFVSHGVPLLHGIEIYKGRAIFYGLGNFIFHLSIETGGRVPAQYLPTPVWQSVMARCEFDAGLVRSIELQPITLKSDQGVGEGSYKLHGNPQLAEGAEAGEILERLQRLSRLVGTEVEIAGSTGRVKI